MCSCTRISSRDGTHMSRWWSRHRRSEAAPGSTVGPRGKRFALVGRVPGGLMAFIVIQKDLVRRSYDQISRAYRGDSVGRERG